MNMQAELRCRCGEVRAVVKDPSPKTVNRVICYCDDCQAFAHQLGRSDLLDVHGGTDVVQVAPATVPVRLFPETSATTSPTLSSGSGMMS